ncbi:MOSC domain-containing protein [Bacteriovoracaceae bacterium]|nr:MOSC domain-containing protein [Bacteriovoracaceae bacterium]
MQAKINNLFTGKPKILTDIKKITSCIRKSNVNLLDVKKDHISNDQCFDLKYHGGSDRVVHFYPSENYHAILEEFPNLQYKQIQGRIGENISTEKLNEKNVSIGDIFSIGETILEITEPRNPCSTIDVGFNQKGILKFVYQSNRIGWFARVLKEGKISSTDTIDKIENPNPKFTIDYVFQKVVKEKGKDKDSISLINQLPQLSKRYREDCHKILS